MKLSIYFLFIAALAAGCNDDSPTQSGDSGLNFVIRGDLPGTWNSESELISLFKTGGTYAVNSLASARIDTSGAFTLAVPPPAETELRTIDWMIAYPIRTRLQISDPSAKFMEGDLVLLYNGKHCGDAQPVSSDSSGKYKDFYYYFDRDVEIKGKADSYGKYTEYNISAKKGWNIIHKKEAPADSSFYLNNIKIQNIYYECTQFIIIPDSLKWGGGVVVPN